MNAQGNSRKCSSGQEVSYSLYMSGRDRQTVIHASQGVQKGIWQIFCRAPWNTFMLPKSCQQQWSNLVHASTWIQHLNVSVGNNNMYWTTHWKQSAPKSYRFSFNKFHSQVQPTHYKLYRVGKGVILVWIPASCAIKILVIDLDQFVHWQNIPGIWILSWNDEFGTVHFRFWWIQKRRNA